MKTFSATAILALTVFGCTSDSGEDPNVTPTGGKSDQATQACIGEHNRWLVEDYAPILCEDGPECVGRANQQSAPSCDGSPDYAHWSLAWDKHVYGPYMVRRAAALEAFVPTTSNFFRDRDWFVGETMPNAAELEAHQALLAIASQAELVDVGDWHERYRTALGEFGFPLYSQDTNALLSAGDGRSLCVDPFEFEASGYACDHEPALYLNASEEAFLSMMEDFRPSAEEDGEFAIWIAIYNDLLTGVSTANFLHFGFPIYTEDGLANYELDFFRLVQRQKPEARGERDSRAWMDAFTVLLGSADLSLGDQVLQLDLLNETKPARLVGSAAYASWLGADSLGLGFSFVSDDEQKLAYLLEAKPCARNEAELSDMQTILESADLNLADTTLVKPKFCG